MTVVVKATVVLMGSANVSWASVVKTALMKKMLSVRTSVARMGFVKFSRIATLQSVCASQVGQDQLVINRICRYVHETVPVVDSA